MNKHTVLNDKGSLFWMENQQIHGLPVYREKRHLGIRPGGDNREIINHFLGEKLGFILRSKGQRHLIYRGKKDSVSVWAVSYFAMVYLGMKTKLRVLACHVLTPARRLFGIPDFRFYALSDGNRELLFKRQKGLESFTKMVKSETLQMKLFDP